MTLSEVLARVQQDQVVVIEVGDNATLADVRVLRMPVNTAVVVYDAMEKSYEIFCVSGDSFRVERTTND